MSKSPWPHFSMEELTCHCGCGQMRMQNDFMQIVVRIREKTDITMNVTSGYRCPNHNAKVSHTKSRTGPHTTGRTIDVQVSGKDAFILMAEAVRQGIVGIGVSQSGSHGDRFLHLDDVYNPTLRPWLWSY